MGVGGAAGRAAAAVGRRTKPRLGAQGPWLRALACSQCMGALAGCGAALPAAPTPQEFMALHAPTYALAGQDGAAEALHAHLAQQLDGEALTRAYREQRALARRAAREGTAVVVDGLRYHSVVPIAAPEGEAAGLAWVRAEWTVTGTVRHQGHAHLRSNRYSADFALRHQADGWRIADQRARSLTRVAAAGAGEAWGTDGRPRAAEPLDPWRWVEAQAQPPAPAEGAAP